LSTGKAAALLSLPILPRAALIGATTLELIATVALEVSLIASRLTTIAELLAVAIVWGAVARA